MIIKGIEISYKEKLLIAFPLFAGDIYTYPEIVGTSALIIPPGSVFRLITEEIDMEEIGMNVKKGGRHEGSSTGS